MFDEIFLIIKDFFCSFCFTFVYELINYKVTKQNETEREYHFFKSILKFFVLIYLLCLFYKKGSRYFTSFNPTYYVISICNNYEIKDIYIYGVIIIFDIIGGCLGLFICSLMLGFKNFGVINYYIDYNKFLYYEVIGGILFYTIVFYFINNKNNNKFNIIEIYSLMYILISIGGERFNSGYINILYPISKLIFSKLISNKDNDYLVYILISHLIIVLIIIYINYFFKNIKKLKTIKKQ